MVEKKFWKVRPRIHGNSMIFETKARFRDRNGAMGTILEAWNSLDRHTHEFANIHITTESDRSIHSGTRDDDGV